MVKKIDHIGIAVRSIRDARKFYEDVLGLVCEKIETITDQKVRTAFFPIGDTHIELLEATGPDSPIAKFIDTNGEGVHHIAYACDNIDGQLNRAQEAGVKLVHREPITGAGEKKVAFLHPKSSFGVLTEFCS